MPKKASKEDLAHELRMISMEYADIKSRIEATDVLVDHVIHQLDVERKMRKLNMLLAIIMVLLASLIIIMMAGGF